MGVQTWKSVPDHVFLAANPGGVVPSRKFGQNHDVGTSVEDITPIGGLYAFPAAAETLGVVSDDANDVAVGTVATISLGDGGADYVQDEVITIVQDGGVGATVVATTVVGGAITVATLLTPGHGYSTGDNNVTIGGTGTGALVDIDSLVGSLTGARTLRIEGLDANYDPLVEDVYLAGATEVVTTGLFLRVNRAYILTAGTSGTNEGTLTIDNTTSGNVVVQIDPLEGQTMQCIFTVPNGYKAVLGFIRGGVIASASDDGEFSLRVRPEGGAWNIKEQYALGSGGSFNIGFNGADVFDGKTDIRMTAVSSQASIEVTGSFGFHLVPK